MNHIAHSHTGPKFPAAIFWQGQGKRARDMTERSDTAPSGQPDVKETGVTDEVASLLLAVGQSKDMTAFEALFRLYGPRLRAFMLKRTGDPALAEELMQEAMTNIWNRAASFDPARGSAPAWIFTLARNTSIDLFRRRKRPEFDLSDPALMPEAEEAADRMIESRQSAEAVRAAMRDLPPEQLEILKLSFFEEVPHSAIAEKLGLPLGTVKSRIRMAFGRLRTALGEQS